MKHIVVIGGGISGLITGIRLAQSGLQCTVIEKKSYPFHRVCGEYISNEAVPFLKSIGCYPAVFDPPQISRFQLSAVSGKSSTLPLDMGGFGVSRFAFDQFLYEKATSLGVKFMLNTEVENTSFQGNQFTIQTQVNQISADLVVGCHGKRSKFDMALDRDFVRQRSPYVGVKYHLRTDHPRDLIALHNFEGGYCGISNIEDGKTNLCYLVHRDVVRKAGSIEAMQREVMFRNPLLKNIFSHAEFLFGKPEVINEISFATKTPVDDHVLMAGDAAGMITPLCGNGMAMAIRAANMVSRMIVAFANNEMSREALEREYSKQWRKTFSARLWEGRQIQKLFGNHTASNLAILLALYVKPVAMGIIKRTHGDFIV